MSDPQCDNKKTWTCHSDSQFHPFIFYFADTGDCKEFVGCIVAVGLNMDGTYFSGPTIAILVGLI